MTPGNTPNQPPTTEESLLLLSPQNHVDNNNNISYTIEYGGSATTTTTKTDRRVGRMRTFVVVAVVVVVVIVIVVVISSRLYGPSKSYRHINNHPTIHSHHSEHIIQPKTAVVSSVHVPVEQTPQQSEPHSFPSSFIWGVATSAYQIEGAVHDDHRGMTIWDTFVRIPNTIMDGSTGNVADNHYQLYKDDVKLLHQLNIQAYRFSIAWSRILPTGRHCCSLSDCRRRRTNGPSSCSNDTINDGINMAGIQFYHNLIDTLLQHDIEPWITLFHWDLPQALQDPSDDHTTTTNTTTTTNSGWLDIRTVDYFVDYADIIFQHFSHKVHRFITINEPWTFSVVGHGSGIHAPGRKDHPSTEPYLVAHNLLLAHVKVAKLYKSTYAGTDGLIGISNCGDYRYPNNNASEEDQEAATRAMLFQWGWFVEPLVFGQYPTVMQERLGDRLPNFTVDEQKDLIGSTDFFGLNYYSSLRASTPNTESVYSDYWADMHVNLTDDPNWRKNEMGWNVVPDGLREMLRWISERYDNPLIYITENGSAEPEIETDVESIVHDESRRLFIEQHIEACGKAINVHGVNLAGYFAWSFLDNFEWQFGYQRRFGICHVNFTTQQRTPRDSALWYRDHIQRIVRNNDNNGTVEGRYSYPNREKSRLLGFVKPVQQTLNRRRPSHLPTNVLIGYGSDCDAVREAVHDGVNIVIWSFIDVIRVDDPMDVSKSTIRQSRNLMSGIDPVPQPIYTISTTLNVSAIRSLIDELYLSGYDDVLHFASVGGWNGAHIDTTIPPGKWYEVFNETVGNMFDGIDWDLEGNDMMTSSDNFFTLDCLTNVGKISQLAKEDGKFISIAPPQSYLNIHSSRFSRYVNLTTDPTTTSRPAPYSTFTYYGSNVYAYLLQLYGSWIDLISVQFYESYSDACYHIQHDGMNASDYLSQYVNELVANHESFYVNFTEDDSIVLPGQNVSFPLHKLVFGLGNGWVRPNENNKTVFISPAQLNVTWQILHSTSPLKLPRGFMFWTIDSEGENGIYFAKELNKILHNYH